MAHKELKAQYKKDAATHPRPWELWLVDYDSGDGGWERLASKPSWYAQAIYRRHKHADKMIEAHLHPDWEWEFDALCDGNFVPCAPQWAENKVYRRKHKHREFLDAVAAGKADEWEVRHNAWGEWNLYGPEACSLAIQTWQDAWETRRKPQTITVNGREVPAPHNGELANGVNYYAASTISMTYYYRMCVGGSYEPEVSQKRGILHLTKEAAVAHAKAMLNID